MSSETSSTDTDTENTLLTKETKQEPVQKPQKQVRFKRTSSSSSDPDDGRVELVQRSQPLQITRPISRVVQLSDSDSLDTSEIPNAQPCKYSQKETDHGEQGNDEASSTSYDPQPSPILKESPNNPDSGRTDKEDTEDIAPTPQPPDGSSQEPCPGGGPSTSTPKESTSGVYSMITKQPQLSKM